MARHTIGFFEKKLVGQPLTVTDFLSKIMFGIDRPNFRKDRIFAMADDFDAKIGARCSAIDKAYKVQERFQKEGYYLFIDSRRIPHRGRFSHTKTCIVARSYEDAIQVVSSKGKPKTIYIEEAQGEQSHKGFIDWVTDLHGKVHFTVHPEYKQPTETTQCPMSSSIS